MVLLGIRSKSEARVYRRLRIVRIYENTTRIAHGTYLVFRTGSTEQTATTHHWKSRFLV
jgi:hypothetical protein